jgi:hypothetical protein
MWESQAAFWPHFSKPLREASAFLAFRDGVNVAADAGSLSGGWLSGHLIRRGWTVDRARKTVIAFASLLMPAGILAAFVSNPFLRWLSSGWCYLVFRFGLTMYRRSQVTFLRIVRLPQWQAWAERVRVSDR